MLMQSFNKQVDLVFMTTTQTQMKTTDEKAYYNKTDVLVEDDNEESIDDVGEGEVDNKSNTGCPMDDNESLDAMESLYTMNDGTK